MKAYIKLINNCSHVVSVVKRPPKLNVIANISVFGKLADKFFRGLNRNSDHILKVEIRSYIDHKNCMQKY